MYKGKIIADDTPRNIFLNQKFTNIGLKVPQTVEIVLKLKENKEIPLSIENTIVIFRKHLPQIKFVEKEDYNNEDKKVEIKQEPIIEVENLSFKYEDKIVLDNINLVVNRGDFIGLI